MKKYRILGVAFDVMLLLVISMIISKIIYLFIGNQDISNSTILTMILSILSLISGLYIISSVRDNNTLGILISKKISKDEEISKKELFKWIILIIIALNIFGIITKLF